VPWFLGAQRDWFDQKPRTYLAVNVLGFTTLAIVAVVSASGLVAVIRSGSKSC
jgi:hypothetical protein